MSIETIAQRAGVSIATVSRVINGHQGVRPETASRVHRIIQEIGYVPNRTAKALVSGRSHILGMIVSDITNPFFPEIIKHFEEVAAIDGYDIITVSSNYDATRTEQAVRRLIQRSVDGIAVMTSEFDSAMIAQLTGLAVPMVFFDIGQVGEFVSTVKVDFAGGVQQAVKHLLSLGHRKIAFIAGPQSIRSAKIRKETFLQSLAEAGLSPEPHLIIDANHKIDGGMRATELLLPYKPTAIMASNDLTAYGALQAVKNASKSVPHDVSVVGFDDIQFSAFTDPPLTTVKLAGDEIAASTFEALIYAREATDHIGCERHVRTHLVVRQSTGSAK